MNIITREELNKKLGENSLTLVEVLGEDYYRKFHLPGAINVPLGDDFDERIESAVPDKSRPVVVYCQNKDCDASPKAAERLDKLGYEEVYDYEAGKDDWREAGLPVES